MEQDWLGNPKLRRLLLFVLAVVALGMYAFLLQRTYTWRGDTHPDFFVEWKASRIALTGGSPYSRETTVAIQEGSKGRLVSAEEDQLAYVYPFYAVFINTPLAFLSYDWATSIRLSVAHAALLLSSLLFIRTIGWRASLWDMLLVLLVASLSYPSFGGLMLGQMAVISLSLLIVAYWALRRYHDSLAGICLAFATMKPQLTLFVLPALLLWSLLQRRFRVVLAFGITGAILFGLAFAVFPAWLFEFVRAIVGYPAYKEILTGPGFLFAEANAEILTWFFTALSVAFLLAAWLFAYREEAICHVPTRNRPWLDGALALTLAMTCFLPPQNSIINQVLLLPAVLLLLRFAPGWATRTAFAIMAVVGTWLAHLYLSETNYGLNMALPPLVVLLALAVWYAAGLKRSWSWVT